MRYNTFNQIHKGLRGLLYDTALRVQQNDFTQIEDTLFVMRQLNDVLVLFEAHAEKEDTYILPPIVEHSAEVAASFEAEHVEDHRLGETLTAHIVAWEKASTDAERFDAGQKIFYTLNEFIAFNLYHMNKEETLLNHHLWKHYDDDEIKLFEQAIIRNTPPEKLMISARWMMRSLNDVEILRWMDEVKRTAPSHLYAMLEGYAKTELVPARWERIRERMVGVKV